jgi:hypothetical protein
MDLTPAGGERDIPDDLFMCSELYIAAFEGHTDQVIGLLEGSRASAAVAGNGWSSPAAQPTGNLKALFSQLGSCRFLLILHEMGFGEITCSLESEFLGAKLIID